MGEKRLAARDHGEATLERPAPERRSKRARGWERPPGPARPLGGEVSAADGKALVYCAETPLAAGEVVVVPRSGGRLSYAAVLDPAVPARLDVGDGCVKQLHPVFVGRLTAGAPKSPAEEVHRAKHAVATLEAFAHDNAQSIANNASVVEILASLMAHQSRRLFACFNEVNERANALAGAGGRPASLQGLLVLGSAAQDAQLRIAEQRLAQQQQKQAHALETLRGQVNDVLSVAIAEVQTPAPARRDALSHSTALPALGLT